MVIRKGSVYWVDFFPGKGSEPLGTRPGLVIQSDVLNDSKISTVIMLAITSTLKFGELPGNVVLNKGETDSTTTEVSKKKQYVFFVVGCFFLDTPFNGRPRASFMGPGVPFMPSTLI